jgi:type IV pilus assembly protein PilY1
MKINVKHTLAAVALLPALLPMGARAQLVISDTLNGAKSNLDWKALTGACLTAGNNTGTVPACVGLPYYGTTTQVGGTSGRLPDAVGSGALRLTNGDTTTGSNGNNQTGAVVSNFTFPSNSGVQVTFETKTYGGNAYRNGDGKLSGADGIAFFLMDGAVAPNVGGNGGSIGYTCSNGNGVYEGVTGGYIGLGIDEFGNFTNPGDATATGPGQKPGSITLRGGGSIAWAALNAKYPTNYPSSLSAAERESAVKNTCKTGLVQDWSGAGTRNNPKNKGSTTTTILDYPLLATKQLDSTLEPIYNQEATNLPTRDRAVPITYSLSITQDGLLSFQYSYNGGIWQPVISDKSIIASNGPLPSTFRFGFTSGTGGGSNVHEITCFKAAQISDTAGSAGGNAQQGSQVQAGTQIYVPLFHPTNWWGQLTAQSLLVDTTTNAVTIKQQANWDASCVLTGGACSATNGTNTAPDPISGREILSWNGTAGVPFLYGNLSATQQAAIGSDTDRVSYLRGDRSKEVTSSGTGKFRVRKGVLGDIMNSSPSWVGYPAAKYTGAWKDGINTSATMAENASGATTYASFSSTNATRTNVTYVGANDGMLHGFRAGAYTSAKVFDNASTNDGKELIAYVPSAVVNSIYSSTNAALDYSSTKYAHNAYVDATPGTGDVFWGNTWHTVLVGGLGAGGNAGGVLGDDLSTANGVIYALDVSDPSRFDESNAASLVLGEWSSANLTCAGETPATCKNHLGSVMGAPVIRRLHDGKWAAIFGNGVNSTSGTAGIFIMSFDPTSGAISFRFINTNAKPVGATDPKNGITNVSAADLDGDNIADYVYAGDLYGKLWRFDLTSATATNWTVGASPLISTGKPITVSPVIGAVSPATGAARVVVSFGTGRKVNQTLASAARFATGTQTLYGIWDWDMSSWNGKSASKYAALTGTNTVDDSTLTAQALTDYAGSNGNISGYRTVTRNAVCWKGSTTCTTASDNNKYGWKLDLPVTIIDPVTGATKSEQIIYDPVLAYGNVVVNTTIPAVDQSVSCTSQPASGFTMAVALEGGAPPTSFFGSTTNNYTPANSQVVAGIGLSATGSPLFFTSGSGKNTTTTMINNSTQTGSTDASGNTINGGAQSNKVDPTGSGKGKRLTWVKVR